MFRKTTLVLVAGMVMLGNSFITEARGGPPLNGCQVSRKGTRIRCPHGMFIRQDVVDRKIASERSGSPSKSKKKSSRKKNKKR